MKFTLKCEHFDYDIYSGKELNVNHTVTHEFRAEDLSTILENFESFLRGSGFYIDGTIDIVKDEEWPVNDCSSGIVDPPDYEHPEANFDWPDEPVKLSFCPVCNIDMNIMKNHSCFDKKCPKVD